MTPSRSGTTARSATPAALAARLPALRRDLLARRAATLSGVARAEDELRRLADDVEPELVEEAQEETAARVLRGLDDRGLARLVAIDRALARLAAGRYGRCDACGHAIAFARLAALPETTTCLSCARVAARRSPRAASA